MNPKIYSLAPREEILWNDLILGDREAFGEIYKLYVKDLFRFGCSLTSDQQFVQDCIQEVFVDLWKYSAQLQRTDNIKLYLFKCLSNRIQKESKKVTQNKSRLTDYLIIEDHFLESIEHKLIHASQDQLLKRKLAKALDSLPLRQKEVINCLFFENFSYEETARIMNINLRSVYTLAWKALSNLREGIVIGIIFCFIYFYL